MEAEPRQNHPDARLVPRMWWPKPGRYRTSGNKNELPWYSRASVPGPNSRRYWHELEEAHNSVIASTYLAISPLLHVSRSVSLGRPFIGSLQRALLVYMSRVDIHCTPVISGDMIDYHVLQIWLTSYRAPHIVRTSNGYWCMGIKGEMSDTVCVTFTWDMYIYELFIVFVCYLPKFTIFGKYVRLSVCYLPKFTIFGKYVRLSVCYLPKFTILASMFVCRFVTCQNLQFLASMFVCRFVCLSVC